MKDMTPKEINEIADLISEKLMSNKKVLTSEEAARYMGISQSYLYKLTSKKKSPTTSQWERWSISSVTSWSTGFFAIGLPRFADVRI